ncbi:hypothetical protein ACGFZB_28700 [Streptomyces cinerochromogenes]|uniref:Uncharacterized protein n=1 Tax=Streptomyces cinerochromogenes TaxID=66422 RepID=A0ABW7BEZ8_9ACTN
MTLDGTMYVTDSDGRAVDVSLSADGHITVCVIADGDRVAKLTYDETQALIDVLKFYRDAADKYGATE